MKQNEIEWLIKDLPNTAIVANGQFIINQSIIKKLINSQYIICCDGAIINLIQHNIRPNIIIGDCDSIPENLSTQYTIIKLADQNSNDLTKALNYLKDKQIKEALIYGASGLREDHSIANLAILYQAIDQFDSLYMISDYGIFSTHKYGNSIINTIPKQQLSFFTFEPTVTISCNELKWQLHEMKFEFLNLGTLNQTTSNQIKVYSTGKFILYRAFETKD